MVKGLVTGLGHTLASGDALDTTSEGALRVNTKRVVSYNTGTTPYSLEAGAGSLADGTGTGSTTAVSFGASFTATPIVQATLDLAGQTATAGSDGVSIAGVATGSVVLMGPSGAGFTWQATGQKY